jgi:transcriptional regulator with XRE-family HTH domain
MTWMNYPPKKLASLRVRAMLTQDQVVELTGLTIQTILNVEKGHTRPRTDTLTRLLNLYAVRIQNLERIANVLDSEPPFSAKYLKRSPQPAGVASNTRNQRLIRRNKLLTLPDEGFQITLNEIMRHRVNYKNGRLKDAK